MNISPPAAYNYTQLSASTTLRGVEILGGILISDATTGTISIQQTGAGFIMTLTNAITTTSPIYIPLNLMVKSPYSIDIAIGGSMNATLTWL